MQGGHATVAAPQAEETTTPEPPPGTALGEQLDPQAQPELAEEWEQAEGEIVQPAQPVHSVRADTQGKRGCWALNKHGEPCGAAAVRATDYCAAHSGIGVSGDPAAYSPIAHAARREALAVRSHMRLALGVTRQSGPRAVLKARAYAEAERLAGVAVRGALEDPKLALKLIDTVDPPVEASLSVGLPSDPEALAKLGLSDLLRLAELHGIEPGVQAPGALPA